MAAEFRHAGTCCILVVYSVQHTYPPSSCCNYEWTWKVRTEGFNVYLHSKYLLKYFNGIFMLASLYGTGNPTELLTFNPCLLSMFVLGGGKEREKKRKLSNLLFSLTCSIAVYLY